MKRSRKALHATTAAALTVGIGIIGTGTAHARFEARFGKGYVGQYWCDNDFSITTGWVDAIEIKVEHSDFDRRGQTMQFKVVNEKYQSLGWSGWFAIPNEWNLITTGVPPGTRFTLCATFGGGSSDPNRPFNWQGWSYYAGPTRPL